MSKETKEQNNDTFDDAAAEEARVKAEARRRRILEKSRDRMGLVSGEPVKLVENNATTTTTTATTTTEAAATTTTTTTEAASDAVAEDVPSASSGSSRMQAMRRRRFAAKKKDSETTDNTAPAAVADTVADADTDATVTTEESTPPAPSLAEEADAEAKKTAAVAAAAAAAVGPKKKYKGVAAMSRQRIKQRNAQESKDRSDDIAKHAPKMAAKGATTTTTTAMAKLPILLHLITILVLFGAGLKIGMDQVVHDHVVVHRELLAPQQHGMGVINLFQSRKTKKSRSTKTGKALLQEQEQMEHEQDGINVQDEFASKESFDDHAKEYEPNIDPLFQLDLDLFTQGDSILMYVARVAVAMHRMNLFIFYYTPIRIVTTLTHIPRRIMEHPPYLFVFALVVRQFAKRILGAGLPDEPQESKSQDILAMIKNYVMTFLANSFPTIVGLYDAFMHVRSDMFIILCGLFVGLTWNHHQHQLVVVDGTSPLEVHDEL